MLKTLVSKILKSYYKYNLFYNKLRRGLFFFLFFLLVFDTFAQNDSLNMLKYWSYRKRLEYFVMPGQSRGESQIVGIRNRMDYGANDINFGQHSIYFGYYLGVLATEFKLLQNSNDTIHSYQTKNELYFALYQFVNYLDKCEHLLFKNCNDSIDGFFIRYNIPCDFLENTKNKSYFNKDLNSKNTFDSLSRTFKDLPPGHPAWIDKVSECDTIPQIFSQDEAIGLLLGLALVYKCMPDSSYEKILARQIAYNVINYIRNSSRLYGKALSLRWIIYKPSGVKLKTREGGFAFLYAQGFMKALTFFDIKNDNFWRKLTRYPQDLFFQCSQFFPGPNPDNNTMITTLAAIGDSWRATIPLFGLVFRINTTRYGIKHKTSYQDWDAFYLLLWDVLNSKNNLKTNDFSKALDQLNKAPVNGPYNYGKRNNPEGTGWSSSYKFHLKKKFQMGLKDGILGNYNGLDYMLFHNLYCIAKGLQLKH